MPKVKGECGVQHTVPRCYRLVWKAIHPAHKKSVRACVRVCLLIMCVVVSVSTCVCVCARVCVCGDKKMCCTSMCSTYKSMETLSLPKTAAAASMARRAVSCLCMRPRARKSLLMNDWTPIWQKPPHKKNKKNKNKKNKNSNSHWYRGDHLLCLVSGHVEERVLKRHFARRLCCCLCQKKYRLAFTLRRPEPAHPKHIQANF